MNLETLYCPNSCLYFRSHLFITQHRWARQIQAYFNMDSGGSGGREIMFQSTGIPWMMNIYNSLAPHPRSTVWAEELFQRRIIPSDTDFRIFRDFGKIAGTCVVSIQNLICKLINFLLRRDGFRILRERICLSYLS